jgi:hypothetical protein
MARPFAALGAAAAAATGGAGAAAGGGGGARIISSISFEYQFVIGYGSKPNSTGVALSLGYIEDLNCPEAGNTTTLLYTSPRYTSPLYLTLLDFTLSHLT